MVMSEKSSKRTNTGNTHEFLQRTSNGNVHSKKSNAAHLCIHTHTSSCLLESEDDRHTHTYIHTSQGALLSSISRSASVTYTHKQLFTGDLVDDDRHAYTHPLTLDCLHTHISHSHLQVRFPIPFCYYTQLAYLFHQCGDESS